MNLIGDARIDLVQKALDGLAQREQAIASNIANVDTPGYQRRDVDFESSLRSSLGQQGSAAPSSQIPSLLHTGAGSAAQPGTASRNDGNNVDIDSEMSELAETQLRYELLTQAAGSRFSILENVVKS